MKEAFEKRFGKNRLNTNRDWTQYFLNSPSKNCLDSIHVDVYNWGRDMFCEKLSPDYAAIREFCDDGDIKGTKKAAFLWLNKEETYANKKAYFHNDVKKPNKFGNHFATLNLISMAKKLLLANVQQKC